MPGDPLRVRRGWRARMPRRLAGMVCAVLAAAAATGCEKVKRETHEWWNKLFLSDLRPIDEEAVALRRELRGLPSMFPAQQSARIGYHSMLSITRREGVRRRDARFLVLDLGRRERIDAVVLVPAEFAIERNPGPGYGFPVRWRLEASDDPAFSEPTVIVDHTGEDFPNPGSLPVVVSAEELEARYVRLTTTRLFSHSNRNLLALGEMMVLQGNRNLAAGLPPESIRGSESEESPPRWSKTNLVDGQSILGAPSGVIPTRSEGFQSASSDSPDTRKQVQIDLGRVAPLQEVRLLPARAGEYPSRRGFGFPLRYKVEISEDPDFAAPFSVASFLDEDVVSPYENPVSLPIPEVPARYVRLTAERLSERNNDYVLAMAEMEVYSGGRNIALRANVTVPEGDSRETGIWSTRFLTDGFNSQRNVMEWPPWFEGLERRQWIDRRMDELDELRADSVQASIRRFSGWTAAVVGAITALAGFVLWRNRRARFREVELLRRRIARDVHDEIGSGLGTIALLSQMAGSNAAHPDHAREEFREIHTLSRQITESLRDIVWFIRPETRTVGDLAQRLRETADSMLAAVPHDFEADPAALRRSLPLEFKRQVLLVFKEALHNLMRHSKAERATIRVGGDARQFTLAVGDDGVGFDRSDPSSGAGLTGMRQRAETLGGRLHIESSPGAGTRLLLEVPWP